MTASVKASGVAVSASARMYARRYTFSSPGIIQLPTSSAKTISFPRSMGKEVPELRKPGVRFFRDVTKIVRVDGEWGVIGSMDGCLREGVNRLGELFSIHGFLRELVHQRAKHGLALLGGHGMVGTLEYLKQCCRFLLL